MRYNYFLVCFLLEIVGSDEGVRKGGIIMSTVNNLPDPKRNKTDLNNLQNVGIVLTLLDYKAKLNDICSTNYELK